MPSSLATLAMLLLGVTSTAAYHFAAPLAVGRAGRAAMVRMQEEGEPEAAPPSSAPKTSPLAGIVGDQTLSEFQKKKDEDNAKRLELRGRINVALPAITLGALALAQLAGGKDAIQKVTGGGGGDPFGNAPGVAEARAKKKERQAKGKAEQKEFMDNLQKGIRGENAVEETKALRGE